MRKLMSLWAVFVVVGFGFVSKRVDGFEYFNVTELPLESIYGISASAAGYPLMVGLTLIQGAAAKGAVCLDGTLPGYHLHRGYGSGANSWLIQLEGGGWCNSIRSCVYRKKTRRGSYTYMEKQIPFTGILSNKAEENPDFFNWNRIKLRYCDGASFAGDREDKVAQLQFRGQRIWLAAVEDLMSKGMRNANQALLSGCSAGGLASILHCDEFRNFFPRSTRVKCLSDAGLFLDAVDVSGGRTLRNFFTGVVKLQGVQKNLPSGCTNHLDPTSCFFPENLIANSQRKPISFTLTDDMDSSQNWLAFSLSNHHIPSHDSSHLSLFEAFNTTSNNPSGVVDRAEEDVRGGATELSILTGGGSAGRGPKLEDFLGGGATRTTDLCQFTGEARTSVCETEIYDSELKTIAASFLRGFSTDQTDAQKQLAVAPPPEPAAKKAVDTFGQRTSIYRGVTRHRWTGRYEAHLWDNSCRREGQSRKGRQVYLGGYDKEEKAARAYDLAALKYWGPTTTTNFPVSNYEKEIEEMKNMTRQEFVASLRRKSSGFSRGASIYRGVTRHHQHGRWQARIGRVAGNKDLYLGTFSTQEEAAEAYDIAAIKFRGLNAVTNFDMSRYDVKSIANSNLPIGGISGKSKTSPDSPSDNNKSLDGVGTRRSNDRDISSSSSLSFSSQPPSSISFALPIKQVDNTVDYWSILGYTKSPSASSTNLFQGSNNGTSTFQGIAPFSMDFPTNSTTTNVVHNNNGFFFNGGGGGGYFEQQSASMSGSSGIPLGTPIALSSNDSYEGGSGFGNWVGPSLHSFQSAKPNLSVFQTPIFGME